MNKWEREEPVLEIGIVFAYSRDGNEPPEYQPIYNHGITWRDPKAKLEKERVQLDH